MTNITLTFAVYSFSESYSLEWHCDDYHYDEYYIAELHFAESLLNVMLPSDLMLNDFATGKAHLLTLGQVLQNGL